MKKYNVLVIDDERIIRDGISKSIDWSALNLCFQGSCEDAFDALDIFNRNPPDIAIVDIRMPGMSGLELIKIVRNEGIPIQFIILSGYGEFESAQKAISFGVKEYLLKPIDPNKLKQSLRDISKELIDRSDISKWTLHRSLKQTLSDSLNDNMELLVKHLFTEKDLFWVLTANCNIDFESFENNDVFWKTYPRFHFIHGLEWEGLNIILMSIHPEVISDERFAFLSALSDGAMSRNPGLIISSATPGAASGIFQQFSECRRKILEFQLSSSFLIDNASFVSEIACLIYTINQNVVDSDIENSRKNSEHLFDVFEKSAFGLEKIKILLLRILNIINTEKRMRKETSLPSHDFQLMNCQEKFQLNREFQSIIVRIIEADREGNKPSHQPWLIEKTKQEIHNHYKDNSLTLRKFCSTVVFTNPDYLGKIFHQYEKKSFHAYLNSIRISAAKELIIQNPNIAMYEVSRQTGFGENSQYFSKVFKHIERVSPSQYRERIRKGILI